MFYLLFYLYARIDAYNFKRQRANNRRVDVILQIPSHVAGVALRASILEADQCSSK